MERKLYNGKWDGIWDRPKYQKIRETIVKAFKDLKFEEAPHKYYIDGKEITCVSNVTHMYQEHFDAEAKAVETSERNFHNPESKYYQMTPEEILKQWKSISKNACEFGTTRHLYAESIFYFMTHQYNLLPDEYKDRLKKDKDGRDYFEILYPEEDAAAKYYEDMPQCIVPILAETKVYDKDREYSGTFDLLTYYDAELDGKSASKSGLIVNDWKTNRDLYKNFNGKKLLPPFDGLLDMPLSIYKLQLSLYQNPLENLGFKVIARRIMWLRPSGDYDKIKLESYVDVLRKDLSERIERDGKLIIN